MLILSVNIARHQENALSRRSQDSSYSIVTKHLRHCSIKKLQIAV